MANAEVTHPEVEVVLRATGVCDLRSGGDAEAKRRGDDVFFGLTDLLGVLEAREAHAQGVVRRPELDHVDAGGLEDGTEVLDRLALFDHQGHYGPGQRRHPFLRPSVEHGPGVAAQPDAM